MICRFTQDGEKQVQRRGDSHGPSTCINGQNVLEVEQVVCGGWLRRWPAGQSEEAAKRVESAVLQIRSQKTWQESSEGKSLDRFLRYTRRPMTWFHAAMIAGLISLPSASFAQGTQPAQSQPAHSAPQQPAAAPQTDASKATKDSAAPAKDDSVTAKPSVPAQAAVTDVTGKDAAHYIIGPEDALQVTVWKEPTLSGTFPVRPDGMISLVLVGDLPAAGRTPMQLSDEITTRLKKYVQDPSVTVLVMAVNSQRIYMMGEVGHVGPVTLAAGMTPLQAIAAAGGLSPFANSKKIYILRGEAGKQQKIPFNYKLALKGDSTQDIKLQPGDTIVVP
jgi:polysaccharide biosynthesis/export protein